jgi:hypothetical protein
MDDVRCSECGLPTGETYDSIVSRGPGEGPPCPRCGSPSRCGRPAGSQGLIRTSVRLVHRRRRGAESIGGLDLHRDTGEIRHVVRLIDRPNDRYYERITDPDGNFVREVDEPLSEHWGHGTANRRKPDPPKPEGIA